MHLFGSCMYIISLCEQDKLHSQLRQTLKILVAEKQKDIPRVETYPIGGTLSFNLPADYPLHLIDVEKLVPLETRTKERTKEGMRKFSFFERLQGWTIEIWQRKKEAHCKKEAHYRDVIDSFYHHERFTKVLRSVPEVVGFILYEDPTAVKFEKKKAAPMEETSNKKVKIEMKPSKTEEIGELTIDDIPLCKDLDELEADLVALRCERKL
uniref:uncharacterized protein LOC105353288 n=1 Tax=Fragaria vesca subsp. vesca TaxID=101020 RepID=UPI0005C924FD|nr:PREDICTED: uncharacterized protein LOC105353288 [Fragaria vesca subsp. vesca]